MAISAAQFETIWANDSAKLYGLACSYMRCQTAADDVMQDVIIKTLKYNHKI